MLRELNAFITNPFLITAVSSWMIAQLLKLIISTIINKNFDINRLFGDGGMPSGHSATVVSLAVASALHYGMGSFQFAIAAVLAIIVCHDAMGVRLETGKQAAILNEIIQSAHIIVKRDLPATKLKELVGHTPIQVFAGAAVGAANAVSMYFLLR